MKAKKLNVEPPNGGWGWMVVVGAQLINVFNLSLMSVFGLIFGSHFAVLKESEARIALVMNLSSAFLNLTGLITGPLMRNFSPRTVAVCGCLCVSLGLILTSMTTTLNQIIFTYSFLVGVGLGVIGPAIFIAISSYFTTKKPRAIGFSMAGTGLGQMILPQVVRFLLTEYGYQGTVLIIGGLALHGVVGATLFQPVEWQIKADPTIVREVDEINPLFDSTSPKILEKCDHEKLEKRNNRFWNRITRSLDYSLLKDARFLILNFGIACSYAINIDFQLVLPLFLQVSGKLDRWHTAICMSVLAAFDVISRVSFHCFTDYLKLTHRITFMIGILALGIFRSILAELSDFIALMVTCAVFGYFRAFVLVNQVLMLSEFCTDNCPEKLPDALGLNMIIKGVSVVAIGQLLGWIRDMTQSYSLNLHYQNVLLTIVMVIWVIEMTLCKRT